MMFEQLPEKENDRDSHRSLILSLSGFSFSALLALIILQKTINHDFSTIIYFLFLSFLCYFFALNIQNYKFSRWHDQFGTALIEVATFSLILSVLTCLYSISPSHNIFFPLQLIGILVWGIDHYIHIKLTEKFLVKKEE